MRNLAFSIGKGAKNHIKITLKFPIKMGLSAERTTRFVAMGCCMLPPLQEWSGNGMLVDERSRECEKGESREMKKGPLVAYEWATTSF